MNGRSTGGSSGGPADGLHSVTALLDALPHPIWIADAATLRIRFANAAGRALAGRPIDDEPPPTLLDLIPPDERDRLRAAVSDARRDPSEGRSLRLRSAIGGGAADAAGAAGAPPRFLDVHARAIRHEDADAVLVTATDATPRIEAASAAAEARDASMRAGIYAAITRDVIWEQDLETGRFWCNESYESVFGYATEQVPHDVHALAARVHPDDRPRILAAIERLREARADAWTESYRYLHADGSFSHIVDHAIARRGSDGRVTHLVGAMTDVTDRAHLEHQLAHSQKLDAIGRLAGGIAHDFNNMLTAILGFAQFAIGDLPADAPARADIEQVVRAANRAAGLTRQLLTFSRKQMHQPRTLDLAAQLRDMDRLLRRLIGEDIELEVRLAPDLAPIRADPAQLEQMIINLAVNARDAMPHGGRLLIAASNVFLDQEFARQYPGMQPGAYAALVVSDTGVGMPPEVLEQAFEPFFTTKDRGRGTGLGLSTVYGTVRQSGGHIAVESAPGRGTTFTIHIPFAPVGDEVAEAEPPEPAALEGAETILVVEDDPLVRQLATTVLAARGYRVLEADGGDAALAASDAHRGAIDLLVTDVVMPRVSGPRLADLLRSSRPEMRVLYLSGFADHAATAQRLPEDSSVLIEKPFTNTELVRRVRQALDG